MPTPTSALEVTGLTVTYGHLTAIHDAHLQLAPGELRGLIGANGSGKSSLFTAILGLLTPERGTIRVLAETPRQARRRSLIGYVPQNEQLDRTFPITVHEVVAAGCYGRLSLTRRLDRTARAAIADALTAVGMTGYERRTIGQLSGGQRKRVMIARALASQPQLLLLDEPFAGVDQANETTITEILSEAVTRGLTLLVSTHDLSLARRLCPTVTLWAGGPVATGSPEQTLTAQQVAAAFTYPGRAA